MGTIVFGMNLSLDGYVAGVEEERNLPPPGIALLRYWIDYVRDLAGDVCTVVACTK